MRTDHVRHQKIDHGTVPLQSIRQASFCIFCTISSQQKHQLVDFFIPFHSCHGNFFSFWQVQWMLGQWRVDRKSSYSFIPTPSLLMVWFEEILWKSTKNSHAVYMQEKWVIRKSTKRMKNIPHSYWLMWIFSHMTCFIQFPSFLPQYILGSNRLLVSW